MDTQVISFNCLLKNKAGRLISSTSNRNVLTATSDDQSVLLYALAKELQDLKVGQKKAISLNAENAYGLYDPNKIILFPRKKIPKTLRPGDSVTIVSKTGVSRLYRVVQFHGDMVSLDGNHPLAGQDLVFEVEVTSARPATREEIDESLNPVAGLLLH